MIELPNKKLIFIISGLLILLYIYIYTRMYFATGPSSGSGSGIALVSVSGGNRQDKKMPMKVFDATVSTFDGVFKQFTAEAPHHKANFILFLADKDPSTNLSWCPDCVRAEPVIYKKLDESADNVALLKAYVGDRPTWRNPGHPWRTDSRFKLKGVPTLIRWEDGAVKARLEDHEAHLEHKISALLSGN